MAEGSKLVHPAQPGQSFSHHAERRSPIMSPMVFINGDNDIIYVEFHDTVHGAGADLRPAHAAVVQCAGEHRLAKVGLILTSPGTRPPAAMAGLDTRGKCYH